LFNSSESGSDNASGFVFTAGSSSSEFYDEESLDEELEDRDSEDVFCSLSVLAFLLLTGALLLYDSLECGSGVS